MFQFNYKQPTKLRATSSLKSLPLRLGKLTNSANLNKSNSDLVLSHMSSSSMEKLDENFCGAFQEHYEYLMDKGLIETCQFSGSQLFQNDYESMSGNVSFKEFLHQYNELKRWLEQMQFSYSDSLSSFCEKYTNQIFYEEILKRSPRRELLNEYACHLVKYHPHLKHDVLSKLNFLNKQWKSIEFSIISKRFHNEDITKDLEEDLKNFEVWLIKVESLVENLILNTQWKIDEITKNLSDHKCLQSDIESHARIINSVLKLSTKLKQSCVECTRFYENGLLLQNRWHCLWLKSLEWQCRLEQELARKKKVSVDLEEIADNKPEEYNELSKDLIKFKETKINNGKIKLNRLNLNSEIETLQIESSLLSSTSSSSSSSPTINNKNSLIFIKKQKTRNLNNLLYYHHHHYNQQPNQHQYRIKEPKVLEKHHQLSAESNSSNNSISSNSDSNSRRSSSSEYILSSVNKFNQNKKSTFFFEEEFNFFKITHSLSSSLAASSSSLKSSDNNLNTTNSSSSTQNSTEGYKSKQEEVSNRKYNHLRFESNRNLQLANYLNKEIKKYLDDLKATAVAASTSSAKTNQNISNNISRSSHNTDDGDIIPFDECEYEKILSPLASENLIEPTVAFESNSSQLESNLLTSSSSSSLFLVKKQRKVPLNPVQQPLSSKSLSFITTYKQQLIKQQKMYQEEIKTMSENNLILNNSVESNDSGGCSSGSESVTGSDKQQIDNIDDNIMKVNLNLEEMNRLTLSSELTQNESCEILYPIRATQHQQPSTTTSNTTISTNTPNPNTSSLASCFIGDLRHTRKRHRPPRRYKHTTQHRSNSSALCNDLSYYYSLTDVKYYNIDDDENVFSSSISSSVSSSSLSHNLESSPSSYFSTSISLSLSSSTSSSSTSSLSMSPRITLPAKSNQLQKSITLPNANEMAFMRTKRVITTNHSKNKLSATQPSQRTTDQDAASASGSSSSIISSTSNSSTHNLLKRADQLVYAVTTATISNNANKTGLYKHKYNKSFSDYCMSGAASSSTTHRRTEQQRRQRLIRFLKNNLAGGHAANCVSHTINEQSAQNLNKFHKSDDYDQNDYEDNDMDSDSCLICNNNKKRIKSLKQSSTSFLHVMPNQLKKSKCYICLTTTNATNNNTNSNLTIKSNSIKNNNNNNITITNNSANTINLPMTDDMLIKRVKNGNEADCDEYDDEYDENSTSELNEYVEDYNFDDQIESETNSAESCFHKCKLTVPQLSLETNLLVKQTNENTDNTVSNEVQKNEVLLNNLLSSVAAIDEASTASDPHWDGYTSSPYYNTSVTIEDVCVEKTQPILPWDELFFELEPMDDVPHSKNNAKKSRSKRNVNLNCSLTHNHHYHHFYHNHQNNQSQNRYLLSSNETSNQKLIHLDLKSKCNRCLCSTFNSNTNDSSKNNAKNNTQLTQLQQHQKQILQRQNKFSSVNCYLNKLNKNSANCSPTESTTNNFSGFSLNESSPLSSERNSCFSNTHTATQQSPSPVSHNIESNAEKSTIHLITLENLLKNWSCETNMEDLMNILNDSLSQWDFSYNLFVRLKSNQTEESQANQLQQNIHDSSVENLDFYSIKSSQDLIKYSEILAACQTNINCLILIKNSIIEYKTNRQLKNKEINEADISNVDFYLPKLDETTIKWKMLESLCIEDNRCLMNFNNLIDELKPLKNKIEQICCLSKQTIYFESFEGLKLKLNHLEENCLTLSDLLNKINLKKEKYKTIFSLSSNENEQSLNLFTQELTCIEEHHKATSILVKVKINTFEKILNIWNKTEESLKCVKYNFNNLKQNFNESALNEFSSELNHFEVYLSNLKSELILSNCFSLNNHIAEIYNSYLQEMDQFKFELNFLKKCNLTKDNKESVANLPQASTSSVVKINYKKVEERKCHDPGCENFNKPTASNNFNYKATTTTTETQYEETNEMMTNIHLDFHMNDSIDENQFQMTSTPRYNHRQHIQIENSNSPNSLRSSANKQENLLQAKTFCDKSMATVDDKSSQTDFAAHEENKCIKNQSKIARSNQSDKRLYQSSDFSPKRFEIKKNLNTHRSLDSGIMCSLDQTSTSYSGLGSYSFSSPLNYSFANKTESSEVINQVKYIKTDASTNTDGPIVQSVPAALNFDFNVSNQEINLRKRQFEKDVEDKEVKMSFSHESTDSMQTSTESEINFSKTELAMLSQEGLNNEKDTKNQIIQSKKDKDFTFYRLIKYFFLLILFICTFVFLVIPALIPSCCDFRKEFLIFNEKNYNYDDTPLPF